MIVASFAAQLDFTLNELEEIRVATSKRSNCVIHGYRESQGRILLELTIKDGELEIVITITAAIQDLDLAKTPRTH